LPFKTATARPPAGTQAAYTSVVSRAPRSTELHRSRGTEGSNPSPSTSESCANLVPRSNLTDRRAAPSSRMQLSILQALGRPESHVIPNAPSLSQNVTVEVVVGGKQLVGLVATTEAKAGADHVQRGSDPL
jgi:hypothetical protein